MVNLFYRENNRFRFINNRDLYELKNRVLILFMYVIVELRVLKIEILFKIWVLMNWKNRVLIVIIF